MNKDTPVRDFHIHYTPESIVRERLGGKQLVTRYRQGVPASTTHEGLFQLDAHIAAMDAASVDIAVLSCAVAMDAPDLETARWINKTLFHDTRAHPDRFIGLAHLRPLDAGAPDELRRSAGEYGSPGAVVASTTAGHHLDDAAFDPFYAELERSRMFLLVHPAIDPPSYASAVYDAYDLYRAIGREHELLACTIRMAWGGVFDRHPGLRVIISHLGGGIAALMGRIRGYAERQHMGVADDPLHGRLSDHPLEYYVGRNLFFDTGGLYGSINAIRAALLEFPASAILLGSDYPQEVRSVNEYAGLVDGIRQSNLGDIDIAGILSGTGVRLFAGE